MKTLQSIMIATLISAGITCTADKARMDISSNTVKLKPVKGPTGGLIDNPGWAGKNKDKLIISQSAPLKGKVWEDYEISFIPDSDGHILISLKGEWKKDKSKKIVPVWVYWDDIVVEGASIYNGTFDKTDGKNKAAGWNVNKENCITKDGKKYIKAWHNAPCSQVIKVKKGQKVTIWAKVKAAK